MSRLPVTCPQDAQFGPVSECRAFDFTLTFESSILSILPSAIYLLLAALVAGRLARAPRLLQPYRFLPRSGQLLLIWKFATCVGASACELLCLAAWVRHTEDFAGSTITIAALATRASASILTLPIIWLEFFRQIEGSTILPLFLTISTLCDIARVRTFAITHYDDSKLFFGSFVAAFSLRIFLWVLETAAKQSFVERAEGDIEVTYEESSSFLAKLFMTSTNPVLIKGFRANLTITSLGAIHSRYETQALYDHGNKEWERHLACGKARPLLRTLFSAFGSTLLIPVVPCVIYSCAQITAPTLITDVINFIESYQTGNPADAQDVANGWGLVGAYLLVYVISSLAFGLFQMGVLRSSVAVRGFLVQMLYRKALKIHGEAAKSVGGGSPTSLMSVDVERIVNQLEPAHLIYSTLIIIVIGLVILYNAVGLSFLATIVAAIVFFVSLPYLSAKVPMLQKSWSATTDLRVKLANSVIRNIKAVKSSGYEDILLSKLEGRRDTEMGMQRQYYRRIMVVAVVSCYLKSLLSLATLVTYTVVSLYSSQHRVNTATFFTAIAVLNVITAPLLVLGQRYAQIVSAFASLGRIQEFLLQQDRVDARETADMVEARNLSVGVENLELLHDMSFSLPQGLTMVIGSVGSGKSTLLHALLGEVDLKKGTLRFPTSASVGFCSQDPWIRPGESVKQNILFVNAFSPALYRTVVKACALDLDFKIWPEGDAQKAQGLSGGQKQRIALARTLYARPEILVLDDVFSAVDKPTEEHIFRAMFGPSGIVKDKQVIMVTNGVHRLPRADYVLLIQDQTVAQQGTYAALCASDGPVRAFMEKIDSKDTLDDTHDDFPALPAEETASSYAGSGVPSVDDIAAEMAAKTSSRKPWLTYIHLGGVGVFAIVFCLGTVISGIPSATPVYIQAWTTAAQRSQDNMLRYMGGYIAIELAYVLIFVAGLLYTFLVFAQNAGRRIHSQEIQSLLRAPVSWFDDKPIGRLLSRFSQDLFVIDTELPNNFFNFLTFALEVIATIIVIVVAAPFTGIVIGGTLCITIGLQRFYVRTSRQVRRMDFIAKSPLYTLFGETMDSDGLKTIRAGHAEDHLAQSSVTKGNTSQVPYYLMNAVKKWLTMVLGLMVSLINTVLVAIAVNSRRQANAGLLAVALVQATSLVRTLEQAVMRAAELETCLVAMSRVQEVMELPREDQPGARDDGRMSPSERKKLGSKADPSHWITAGSVRFQNVVLRYKPDHAPALKDLSFRVRGGTRVGIVGRSGCGKSTCLAALFRMNELESGTIFVDGIDITMMTRADLRQAMTIIPQDPLLLELSVRENLDLEGACSDQEIWDALEQTHCKAIIEALPEKLDTVVTGDGGDFSRGERQLLALARGLLRKRKLLVLDEASSSLDVNTDALIQQVLRTAFKDCTVIAIAHRLNTLLDYDDIIVLSYGELVEMGSPQMLMQNPTGAFSKLLRGEADGAQTEDALDAIAVL